ncbi:nucleotidyltransferase domain-containing protein [Aristaeella lactis]|uniref:Uncharacterized nucleotidyltransferase n=1 Tax=Aristaeella lactis TaxID=3046383 RepID=A0AC61PJ48_9FIRM|nr:nucleotidyltransferase family protein [Aristaeella lactis]QUA54034.1 nucleotidyltransferase family protein [Aristaeella lactis]SMC42552.1 Uncharacterised nucleotidyltransferase [Aristaeella lactis]
MTKEQSFFIQILSDHLNGRETGCVDNMDWNVIHSYALTHQVSGIVFEQARNCMPIEMQLTFRKEAMATLFYAAKRDNDFDSVKKALSEKNISYFVVKGPIIAELYPSPKLRSMGDIDLVIHREDRDSCNDILIQNGYECRSKQDDREWQYYKNGIELELHDRLVYEENVNEEGHDLFFNNCWRYVENHEINWSFHLLFLIFHLRKHFMNSGVGFRQFMDLAVVVQKIDIDWNWLKEHLKSTGMYRFAKKCFGFIERWFGLQTPMAVKIDEVFFAEATQIIISNGVFGFDNKDNIIGASVNEMRNTRFPRLALICQYMKEFFPSWKVLSRTNIYGYLKHSKLLLPIAWIHRWWRQIKRHVFLKERVTIRKPIASMQEYDSRMIWMRRWGLLNKK